MNLKQKAKWVLPILMIAILIPLVFLKKDVYYLNRTAREIFLRIHKIQILSKRRGKNFIIGICRDHYYVDSFDNEIQKRIRHTETKYKSGISSSVENVEFQFYRGNLTEFRFRDELKWSPMQVIIHFHSPNVSKTRSFIFYKDGHWRILN